MEEQQPSPVTTEHCSNSCCYNLLTLLCHPAQDRPLGDQRHSRDAEVDCSQHPQDLQGERTPCEESLEQPHSSCSPSSISQGLGTHRSRLNLWVLSAPNTSLIFPRKTAQRSDWYGG